MTPIEKDLRRLIEKSIKFGSTIAMLEVLSIDQRSLGSSIEKLTHKIMVDRNFEIQQLKDEKKTKKKLRMKKRVDHVAKSLIESIKEDENTGNR